MVTFDSYVSLPVGSMNFPVFFAPVSLGISQLAMYFYQNVPCVTACACFSMCLSTKISAGRGGSSVEVIGVIGAPRHNVGLSVAALHGPKSSPTDLSRQTDDYQALIDIVYIYIVYILYIYCIYIYMSCT